MVCIYCKGKTKVINSRWLRNLNYTWRRRSCITCQSVFTTVEQVDGSRSFMVQTDRQHLSPFSRDKLLISLYQACGHRPTALDDAAALTDTIITKLLRSPKHQGLFATSTIRNAALITLKHFDDVAATYYQAYYP